MNQALLVIDAQQELMDGSFEQQGVFEKDKVIQNINRIVRNADENVFKPTHDSYR
ncbi:hypothetical protein [Rummeliibacillus sp. POC4]|uniref:hypothetical protein n=1 Tax=Rummeliibacillus sp. POC4 TaxID=2305899 RepID=UPI0013145037|nr:hypothetical protein [Rummeliibacillus sp. POC4]